MPRNPRTLALALLLAWLSPGCVSVSAVEPPSGSAPRLERLADDEPVLVVISAIEHELQLLLEATDVEMRTTLAGRVHHVGRLAGHRAVLFLGGVSMVNAAAATQAVIDHFNVSGIVFSGIAGGVNPNLAIGDVTVPAQWGQYLEMVFARAIPDGWDTGGRARQFANFGMMFPRGQLVFGGGPDARPEERRFWLPVDEAMLAVAREVAETVQLSRCTPANECLDHEPRVVVGGNGLSGSVFMDNAEFREYLWSTFAADAVDMETAAIAQVALINEVPFLGFRSLSDLAGGGPGGNQIRTFGRLASENSARVLLEFLRQWPRCRAAGCCTPAC